jgi:excinuclease ABC subunit B
MYADRITRSMQAAIDETQRRRDKQIAYNTQHNITPASISKQVRDLTDRLRQVIEEQEEQTGKQVAEGRSPYLIQGQDVAGRQAPLPRKEIITLIKDLEKQMKQAARNLEFEQAAALRDQIVELRKTLALEDEARQQTAEART